MPGCIPVETQKGNYIPVFNTSQDAYLIFSLTDGLSLDMEFVLHLIYQHFVMPKHVKSQWPLPSNYDTLLTSLESVLNGKGCKVNTTSYSRSC